MKKVLIILPTYNEVANVENIIRKLLKIGEESRYSFAILVVDDNSPDGTGSIVKKLMQKYKAVHLLSGQRRGLGRAYIRGLKHGLKLNDYFAFILMDADFSHHPMHIPELLAVLNKGNDYVIGSRYVRGGITRNWPATRSVKSYLANSFARLMLDLSSDVRDMTGGFKVLRVSALRHIDLDTLKAKGFVFQVNLLHEFFKRGFKIAEVPIDFKNRESGKSKMRTSDILEFLYLTYTLNPHSRIRRLIRFCFVGASGVVVNLAVLIMLVQLANVRPGIAYPIALEASILSNFFLNHYYTFRASITAPAPSHKDKFSTLINKLVKYNFVALGGAGISFFVFYLLYGAGLHYIPSDLAAIIAATSWNYYMSVKVVWRLVDE